MKIGRPKAELVLTESERPQVESFARGRPLPSPSKGSRIILFGADGEPNSAIGARMKIMLVPPTNGTANRQPLACGPRQRVNSTLRNRRPLPIVDVVRSKSGRSTPKSTQYR